MMAVMIGEATRRAITPAISGRGSARRRPSRRRTAKRQQRRGQRNPERKEDGELGSHGERRVGRWATVGVGRSFRCGLAGEIRRVKDTGETIGAPSPPDGLGVGILRSTRRWIQGRRPVKSRRRICNGASSLTSPLGPVPKTPVCAMKGAIGESCSQTASTRWWSSVSSPPRARARSQACNVRPPILNPSSWARHIHGRVVDDPVQDGRLLECGVLGRRSGGEGAGIVAHEVAVESDYRLRGISAVKEPHRHDAFTDDVTHASRGPSIRRTGSDAAVGRR